MNHILPILAEQATPGLGLMNLLPIVAMLGIFYFLLIRPQRQQQKKADEMRSNLSKNDKIVTLGGIHGIITGLTDKTVTIKVDEGVSVKFDRTSVGRVVSGSKSDDSE